MKKNTKKNFQVNLNDKVIVVIGGTGSIGEEISVALMQAKAKVIAVSPKETDISPGLKKYIDGKKISFLEADVLKEEKVKEASEKIVKKYGRVDILLLVQGIQKRKPFFSFTLEEWNKILDVNLTGTFLACKYFTKPMMEKKSGKVIGITSLTSEFGIKNISAYAASKGGMSQFLKTVAIELSDYNINVNMIAPGRIKTKMTADLMKDKKMVASNLRCIPLNRFGTPADIVGAVLFLSSNACGYITGQTLFVDGGWLASGGNPGD